MGRRVVLGAGCTVLGDVAIGDDCTVGAGSIVTKEVPPGSTVVGVNKIVTREGAAAAAEPGGAAPPAGAASGASDADYTWYYDI